MFGGLMTCHLHSVLTEQVIEMKPCCVLYSSKGRTHSFIFKDLSTKLEKLAIYRNTSNSTECNTQNIKKVKEECFQVLEEQTGRQT